MPHRMMLAPPENVMVQCENLVKIYKTTDVEVMALQGLDLTVERGELMGIVGASGSGKSTLLNMLGALDKLIFADEPTAALDMPTGLAVMNLFKELVHTDGLTIVMTTHDTAMMEQCDVVYTLDDGRITDVRKQVE